MTIDYQSLLYDPIYQTLGVPITLTTSGTGGEERLLTALNLTRPNSIAGFGVDFQAFQPSVKIRMAEISGLSPRDDILGGELVMDGATWNIKSYEYNASPNGNSDGELRLILSAAIAPIVVPVAEIELSATSVLEGSANGTEVATASISGDYTGTPVWSISDADGTFAINSSTGVITVLDNTDLDADVHPTIATTISVTGITPAADDLIVNITVGSLAITGEPMGPWLWLLQTVSP